MQLLFCNNPHVASPHTGCLNGRKFLHYKCVFQNAPLMAKMVPPLLGFSGGRGTCNLAKRWISDSLVSLEPFFCSK